MIYLLHVVTTELATSVCFYFYFGGTPTTNLGGRGDFAIRRNGMCECMRDPHIINISECCVHTNKKQCDIRSQLRSRLVWLLHLNNCVLETFTGFFLCLYLVKMPWRRAGWDGLARPTTMACMQPM